ncbi:MAG: hypothetical protein WA711_06635 [Pseudolabrys sp.]
MSNRQKQRRFEANMPGSDRPLAFPEVARGRTFAQPWNIKVEPVRRRVQGIEGYNSAWRALIGLGLFATVSAAVIVLRVAAFLPGW